MLLIIDNQFGINQNTNSVLVNKIFDFKACNCAEKIRGVDGNTPYFLTAIVADHVTSLNPPPPGLFLYPPQPGGGGVGSDPPAISKTDGRRETGEAAFERSRRDASKPLSKIQN